MPEILAEGPEKRGRIHPVVPVEVPVFHSQHDAHRFRRDLAQFHLEPPLCIEGAPDMHDPTVFIQPEPGRSLFFQLDHGIGRQGRQTEQQEPAEKYAGSRRHKEGDAGNDQNPTDHFTSKMPFPGSNARTSGSYMASAEVEPMANFPRETARA